MEDATPDDLLDPTITAPTPLTIDQGQILDITDDDRVVYQFNGQVQTVKAASTAPTRLAASKAGLTTVDGRAVFTFYDLDYEQGTANLVFWTPTHGRRSVGQVLLGESLVASDGDDAHVLFTHDPTATTVDLVVSDADRDATAILLDDVPRGDESTCGPVFGFAGDRVIAAHCQQGSFVATLSAYAQDAQGSWQETVIANDAVPFFASDETGDHLLYIADNKGWLDDGTSAVELGTGVVWGKLSPDGQVAYFTVGDQLRRYDGQGPPVPIVVSGFGGAAGWSEDLSVAVYSDVFDYDNGTKQNLAATTTTWFNPTPTEIEAMPVAVTSRSAITAAGNYVVYLTGFVDGKGTLNVVPTAGGAGVTLSDVETVVRRTGDSFLLSTEPMAGESDLYLYDADTAAGPQLIEASITEAINLRLRSDRDHVIYGRGGSAGGIFIRPLP